VRDTPHFSVLLILVAGIGDFVMATPAIRAVRNGHPQARLHLLTSSEAAVIARRHPGVDRVFAFPIREMRRGRLPLGAIVRVIGELRRTTYDIAANLYPVCSRAGSLKMGLLFACLKARVKAGHAVGWAGVGLDRRLPGDVFAGRHRVETMMAIARAVGGRPVGARLEIRAVDHAAAWERLVASHASGTGMRVGINPGGDRPNRRWPASRFIEVARDLAGRCGATIVVFGGPGEEEAIAGRIADALDGAAVNLAGRLGLEELPYFLSRCDLLISNDSGPMHIAAAMQVPVVAIFGPEDANVFKPYVSPQRCRVLQHDVDCRPCARQDCGHPVCLDGISAASVSEAALQLLGLTRSEAPTGESSWRT